MFGAGRVDGADVAAERRIDGGVLGEADSGREGPGGGRGPTRRQEGRQEQEGRRRRGSRGRRAPGHLAPVRGGVVRRRQRAARVGPRGRRPRQPRRHPLRGRLERSDGRLDRRGRRRPGRRLVGRSPSDARAARATSRARCTTPPPRRTRRRPTRRRTATPSRRSCDGTTARTPRPRTTRGTRLCGGRCAAVLTTTRDGRRRSRCRRRRTPGPRRRREATEVWPCWTPRGSATRDDASSRRCCTTRSDATPSPTSFVTAALPRRTRSPFGATPARRWSRSSARTCHGTAPAAIRGRPATTSPPRPGR